MGRAPRTHETPPESRPLSPSLDRDSPVGRETYASEEGRVELGGRAALLNLIKEEMFAIESEKVSGALSSDEYAEVKAGLQALLRRSMNAKDTGRNSALS